MVFLQVSCVGQMLCAVVADTRAHAKRGAAAVKVDYEDLPDPIFTSEVCGVTAVKQDAFLFMKIWFCASFCPRDLLIGTFIIREYFHQLLPAS